MVKRAVALGKPQEPDILTSLILKVTPLQQGHIDLIKAVGISVAELLLVDKTEEEYRYLEEEERLLQERLIEIYRRKNELRSKLTLSQRLVKKMANR